MPSVEMEGRFSRAFQQAWGSSWPPVPPQIPECAQDTYIPDIDIVFKYRSEQVTSASRSFTSAV